MKRILVILLALFVVFAMFGCKDSGDEEKKVVLPGDPYKGDLTVPAKLELEENTYDTGYQAFVNVGRTIKKDDEYTLNVTFTVSRNVPGGIQIGLVDTVTDYWNPLSYDGDAETGTPGAIFQTEALITGIEYSLNEVFKALKDSGGTTTAHNRLVFQTEKEYVRGDSENGKHTAAADTPGPVTIFFEAVIPSGNPLEEFVVKAYTDFNISGEQAEFNSFGLTDITKFKDSKYIVIVSQGHTKNADGFGGVQICYQGGGLDWTATDLLDGWISISHSATDIICFVVGLENLDDYDTFLDCTDWTQFFIKYYGDGAADLGIKAVLLMASGADAVFSTLDDKVNFKVGSVSNGGFASKKIDVTGLY